MFQKNDEVKLVKLTANKAKFKSFVVGLIGIVTIPDKPIRGYTTVKWSNGIETDSRNDTLEKLQ